LIREVWSGLRKIGSAFPHPALQRAIGRPARLKAEFKVDKDYPRHRDDPEIVALRREILGTLGLKT